MEEITCMGGVLSFEAPFWGRVLCIRYFPKSPPPQSLCHENLRGAPHLRGVPHRPHSALLAPGSLSQPPPGLLGAGSGVQCETKLRMSRPSPEGAGPGRGQGLGKR